MEWEIFIVGLCIGILTQLIWLEDGHIKMIDWFKQKLSNIRLYFSKPVLHIPKDFLQSFDSMGILVGKIADNSITATQLDPNAIVVCSNCKLFASPNSKCVMCGHVNERSN